MKYFKHTCHKKPKLETFHFLRILVITSFRISVSTESVFCLFLFLSLLRKFLNDFSEILRYWQGVFCKSVLYQLFNFLEPC